MRNRCEHIVVRLKLTIMHTKYGPLVQVPLMISSEFYHIIYFKCAFEAHEAVDTAFRKQGMQSNAQELGGTNAVADILHFY